ncbi:cation/H(+) antiporter 18 [Senna tora]|uniref:Cation/H(+) antiporter 18 n=1 Tax=Senna tora TaxID=362788 RepID=A0A834WM30_9FABA|nr:cation/H(+) antiporter 18 [Senna tora]
MDEGTLEAELETALLELLKSQRALVGRMTEMKEQTTNIEAMVRQILQDQFGQECEEPKHSNPEERFEPCNEFSFDFGSNGDLEDESQSEMVASEVATQEFLLINDEQADEAIEDHSHIESESKSITDSESEGHDNAAEVVEFVKFEQEWQVKSSITKQKSSALDGGERFLGIDVGKHVSSIAMQTSIHETYAKYGCIYDAHKVFDERCDRDSEIRTTRVIENELEDNKDMLLAVNMERGQASTEDLSICHNISWWDFLTAPSVRMCGSNSIVMILSARVMLPQDVDIAELFLWLVTARTTLCASFWLVLILVILFFIGGTRRLNSLRVTGFPFDPGGVFLLTQNARKEGLALSNIGRMINSVAQISDIAPWYWLALAFALYNDAHFQRVQVQGLMCEFNFVTSSISFTTPIFKLFHYSAAYVFDPGGLICGYIMLVGLILSDIKLNLEDKVDFVGEDIDMNKRVKPNKKFNSPKEAKARNDIMSLWVHYRAQSNIKSVEAETEGTSISSVNS